MQEVETLLLRLGFVLARVSGSHHIYEYNNRKQSQQIVVPLHGRKVKKIYVEQITALLDQLFPVEDPEKSEAAENEHNN